MSNVGGLLGSAGGANGTGFAGPNTANLVPPAEISNNYGQAQQALAQQQAFAQAVQPGGQAALNSQQQLLGQLQQGAQGQGPNPALAQLNQATGQNVANQNALMAGQRGASQNVGMMSRQAAQQGAATQQQAVGQAATMSAQQQIAYMQQLQAQQAQMVGQQSNAVGAYTQGTQNEQMGLLNAAAGLQANVNNANAGLIGATMGQQASIGSSMSKSIGSAMGMAEGGQVHSPMSFANGGQTAPMQFQNQPAALGIDASGPLSSVGQWFSNIANIGSGGSPDKKPADKSTQPGKQDVAGGPGDSDSSSSTSPGGEMGGDSSPTFNAAEGGRVPALVSPGEQYLSPKELKKVVKGGKNPLSVGERIPGTPKHPGNDYRNDTVKKTLKEGGLVIPNAVMQSKNPHFEAMKFVHAHIAKNRKGLPK